MVLVGCRDDLELLPDGGAGIGADAGDDAGIGADAADDADRSRADSDASTPDAGDAGTVVPNSCAVAGDGRTNCGAGGTESCCTSLPVTGGMFSRSYDGISSGYTDNQNKATVADFRLDKYEVTVGRFRKFVDAVVGGWTPLNGSGTHTHLNGGSGLATTSGGNEVGWEIGWNTNLPSSTTAWEASLECNTTRATWTPTAGANERRPINCVSWYQASAFCIWDGGFLPSDAEWNYAAAGGSEQRVYPWSSPPSTTAISDAEAVYCGGSCAGTRNVGSTSPSGNGRYGQADMAGNVWEWVQDWVRPPPYPPCNNCADLTPSPGRVFRGGAFSYGASDLLASVRYGYPPTGGTYSIGARCSRTP